MDGEFQWIVIVKRTMTKADSRPDSDSVSDSDSESDSGWGSIYVGLRAR